MRRNMALLSACVVILLAVLTLKAHAADLPWFSSGGSTVSAGFALHMAELEARRFATAVSQFVSIS